MSSYKYIDFKNTPVRYTDKGSGRAIVLLHGFLESLEMWDEYAKKLSKSYRVITIDLLGHGQSGSIGYVHSMELMANCIKYILDEIGVRRYIMIGHSMGGYAALAFAELYTENLLGLGLFHSTSEADTEEKKTNRNRAIAAVKSNHVSFIENFFHNLFAPENIERLEDEITRMQKRASSMQKQAVVNALEGMKIRKSRTGVLQKLSIPILFIIGKQDTRFDMESILKETEKAKRPHSLVLENAGHMGFLEAPAECLKAIKKFIRRCL